MDRMKHKGWSKLWLRLSTINLEIYIDANPIVIDNPRVWKRPLDKISINNFPFIILPCVPFWTWCTSKPRRFVFLCILHHILVLILTQWKCCSTTVDWQHDLVHVNESSRVLIGNCPNCCGTLAGLVSRSFCLVLCPWLSFRVLFRLTLARDANERLSKISRWRSLLVCRQNHQHLLFNNIKGVMQELRTIWMLVKLVNPLSRLAERIFALAASPTEYDTNSRWSIERCKRSFPTR